MSYVVGSASFQLLEDASDTQCNILNKVRTRFSGGEGSQQFAATERGLSGCDVLSRCPPYIVYVIPGQVRSSTTNSIRTNTEYSVQTMEYAVTPALWIMSWTSLHTTLGVRSTE